MGAQNLLLLGAMEDSWNQGQRVLVQSLFSLFLVVCDLNKWLYVSAPHHPWVQLIPSPSTMYGENTSHHAWPGTLVSAQGPSQL